MNLNITLIDDGKTMYETNITNNVITMAMRAGIYDCLWRPAEHGYDYTNETLPILLEGMSKMLKNPHEYRSIQSSNGWGTFDQFMYWLARVIIAYYNNPFAKVFTNT